MGAYQYQTRTKKSICELTLNDCEFVPDGLTSMGDSVIVISLKARPMASGSLSRSRPEVLVHQGNV